MKKIDITGVKFGKLTAIYEVEGGKDPKWFCRCDCGNTSIVYKTALRKGATKSCGCLMKEINGNRYRIPIDQVYKELIDKGYEFIEWVDEYKNAKSKLKIKNKKSIEFITTMDVIRRNLTNNYQLHDDRNSLNGQFVYDYFIKRGLIPLFNPKEYKNTLQQLPFTCPDHKDKGVQYKSYNCLKESKNKCRYCTYDIYRGDLDKKLYKYLRCSVNNWRKDSRHVCGNKCMITGKKLNDIHHLYSFTKIVIEVFQLENLDIYDKIENYSQDELLRLSTQCIKLHYKYGYGIGLCKSIHKLFHHLYGLKNNTPSQFLIFIQRLESHEFDTYLKENNLKLNINYEILDKLLNQFGLSYTSLNKK